MCFGPVVPDGYGVCYNPMNEHINFAVSSFNTCKETSAPRLAQAMADALLDMRTVLDQTPRAKLWGSNTFPRTGHRWKGCIVWLMIYSSHECHWTPHMLQDRLQVFRVSLFWFVLDHHRVLKNNAVWWLDNDVTIRIGRVVLKILIVTNDLLKVPQ